VNGILEAALSYAARGWPVLPCRPKGKTPLCAHGVHAATTDKRTIRDWWVSWPSANVGIACGAASGLVVLDVDAGHGGEESLAKLEREHGALPVTVEAHTGGGGRHLFFRHPGGRVKNRVCLRPGLDVRGDGGYVVAPPSVHESGGRYIWEQDGEGEAIGVAPIPDWLLTLLRTHPMSKTTNPDTEQPEKAEQDCMSCSVAQLLCKPEVEEAIHKTLPDRAGVRNRRIFDFARRLKAIPEIAALEAQQLLPVMQEWHTRALPYIGTRPSSESWLDFLVAWERVILPHGAGLAEALERAKLLPVESLPLAVRALGDEASLLARLCLALGDGGRTFFLGCRDAGRLIGKSHAEANKLLRAFVPLKFLEIVRAGTPRRAARYKLFQDHKEVSREEALESTESNPSQLH